MHGGGMFEAIFHDIVGFDFLGLTHILQKRKDIYILVLLIYFFCTLDTFVEIMFMSNKRRKYIARRGRSTSEDKLPIIIDREYWQDYTLFLAVSSDIAHQKLSTVRPAIIANGTYIMSGYEYALMTSIRHSVQAGKVARNNGHILADLVSFRILKAARRECIYAFF